MDRARRQRLRRIGVPAAALLVAATGGLLTPGRAHAATAQERIPGFTANHSSWEHRYEQAYMKLPSADVAERLDAYLSREPGLLATSGDRRRVRYVVDELRSYGLDPRIHTYYTYLSVPKRISVEMTGPERLTARNKEPAHPWQHDFSDVVVGYNALSPSGDVEAPAVYANYATADDFDTLEKMGVSVKGKIVIARYGQVFRGVKTNLAAEHGAVGLVLYDDPADDGFARGEVYPEGPWRSPRGIQRGSVQKLWLYGGDPLTPGWAATKDARRISPDDANLGDIPTVPIGYGDAQPMLASLSGPEAPESWQGGLPFTYRVGSGPTKVHLDLDIDYTIKPIWDVTVRIPGRVHPHQVVYVGAHRDSWTYGSDDDLSGAENVLQVARGLGALLKQGWQPDRSIVLSTWDGEEYGLYGSTEYAEQQGMQRLDRAVAYVNMDGAGGRDFSASGTPALDDLVYDATKRVAWPGTGKTIYAAWAERQGRERPEIGRLGSGSDYTAFFDHFGVPSVDIGSSTPGGDYHCACDDFYWMSHFGDPTWAHHKAMAQLAGLMALRLANADVVPLSYSGYAGEVGDYLRAFQRAQQQELGRQVVDVSRDIEQAAAWQRAAEALQARAQQLLRDGDHARELAEVNAKLMRGERDLLTDDGLPGRPWFRHQIYAPGVNEGYGTQELPALHDALLLHHDADQARRYERLLHDSLMEATRTLTS